LLSLKPVCVSGYRLRCSGRVVLIATGAGFGRCNCASHGGEARLGTRSTPDFALRRLPALSRESLVLVEGVRSTGVRRKLEHRGCNDTKHTEISWNITFSDHTARYIIITPPPTTTLPAPFAPFSWDRKPIPRVNDNNQGQQNAAACPGPNGTSGVGCVQFPPQVL
jgi:hypothetical protein